MRPTSPSQHAAFIAASLPQLESVADEIWCLGMPMSNMTMPYSLAYLIRDAHRNLHVIDPGSNSPGSMEVLARALAQIGQEIDDIETVMVTHQHRDHIGLAATIRKASGARVVMHAAEQTAIDQAGDLDQLIGIFDRWDVPPRFHPELAAAVADLKASPLDADQTVVDGEDLGIAGRTLVALHTPGHTPGHLVLDAPDDGVLFTGDHVLPNINPGVGLGGISETALTDYLDSLSRTAQYDDREACPGHGYRFRGLVERCAAIRDYQQLRASEVEEAVALGHRSVWAAASTLRWSSGWQNLRGFHLLSALLQTAMRMRWLTLG